MVITDEKQLKSIVPNLQQQYTNDAFEHVKDSFVSGGLAVYVFPMVPAEVLNRIVKGMKRDGRDYKNFEHLRNRFLYSQRANTSDSGNLEIF